MRIAIRKCEVCNEPFESEGLLSCPRHSFGGWKDITDDEEIIKENPKTKHNKQRSNEDN